MKRQDYITWDEYFMGLAILSAERSKDPNTQVGACIVNGDNKIISVGYNGAPNGYDDDKDMTWERDGDFLNTKYAYVCHSELNAILNSDVKGHKVVLRTPIDINLTKELNILSIDAGIKKVDIIVDPDTGCIGYGIDYGYSIIERMIEAKNNGDDMLDVPIIVFSGLESYKAKEAKSKNLGEIWGESKTRSYAWEIATTTALICAGVDIAVLWHPEIVDELKRSFQGIC